MFAQILRISIAGFLLVGEWVHADENLWMYARGTDTRPEGSWEIKLNSISRLGKGSGDYAFHDIRPEIEYGFTNSLTASAALLIFHHDFSGIEAGNDPVHETQEASGGSVNDTSLGGFEIKLKYNIFSPYKDWAGLSVGLGYEKRNIYRLDGAPIKQHSLVPQLFIQKNFLDDTLVFAFFGKMELERRKSPGVLEEEIAFDASIGVSYRIAPRWFLGVELRSQSDYLCVEENGIRDPAVDCSSWDLGDFKLGTQFQNGQYFGPSIHYAEERWYATVSALYQVFGGGYEGDANGDGATFKKDGKNYDEHEDWHIGFNVGYNF